MGTPADNSQPTLYTGLALGDEYTFESGVCVLPIAQEPPTDPVELASWSPVVLLQLHAPYRIRSSNYQNKKQNSPPIITAPVSAGKFVFLGGSVSISSNINGTYWDRDWNVTGVNVFVENCVSRVEDGLVLTSPPIVSQADVANLGYFSTLPPQIGAVSEAGWNAIAGYNAGTTLTASSSGTLNPEWSYNNGSFFPGQLFNSDLANGQTVPLSALGTL